MTLRRWPFPCRISRAMTWSRSAARSQPVPKLKIVLGPGTGLGMAALAPLPQGGWMALPGELGHVTLPTVTREEFDLRETHEKARQHIYRRRCRHRQRPYLMYKTLVAPGKIDHVPKPSCRRP